MPNMRSDAGDSKTTKSQALVLGSLKSAEGFQVKILTVPCQRPG